MGSAVKLFVKHGGLPGPADYCMWPDCEKKPRRTFGRAVAWFRSLMAELLGRLTALEELHQAALASGGVVGMDDASGGRLVELADGRHDGFLGGSRIAGFDRRPGLLNMRTRPRTIHLVVCALLFVLPNPLLRGACISQEILHRASLLNWTNRISF